MFNCLIVVFDARLRDAELRDKVPKRVEEPSRSLVSRRPESLISAAKVRIFCEIGVKHSVYFHNPDKSTL